MRLGRLELSDRKTAVGAELKDPMTQIERGPSWVFKKGSAVQLQTSQQW